MITNYKGPIGTFSYDTDIWEIRTIALGINGLMLVYIGNIVNGGIVGNIPKGVTDCTGMFYDCTLLEKAPTIPEGVTLFSYVL